MTVKVMLLKSGEDVISDAQEVKDKETNSIIAYFLKNPYVMQLSTTHIDELDEDETGSEENEENSKVKIQVSYTHWAPLAKQREFYIPADWVVTLYDPHDNINNDYVAKHTPEQITDQTTTEIVNESETDPAQ